MADHTVSSRFVAIVPYNRPPTWRGPEPTTLTYFYLAEEPDRSTYALACRLAQSTGLPNPRVLTPEMVSWASWCQPAFYRASRGADVDPRSYALRPTRAFAVCERAGTTVHWLESTLFLAGVTISAAIIQKRFSRGTLVSKLDRLWQAGRLAEAAGISQLAELDLRRRVVELAEDIDRDPVQLLVKLKALYGEALHALRDGNEFEMERLSAGALPPALSHRFAFRDSLARQLNGNLVGLLAFGSAVNSENFADFDLMVVVKDRAKALSVLAGTNPLHDGVELNISLFDVSEFGAYQAISGDNLSHHALCLWGELDVPHKRVADLVHRNFSFGYIRMRQISGMRFPADPASITQSERASLYGYFTKIPLNVARGVLGAMGESVSKEALLKWASVTLDYRLPESHGVFFDWIDPLADAAWATNATLGHFNGTYGLYEVCS